MIFCSNWITKSHSESLRAVPKAVLTTRIDSIYDDLLEVRYHFPHTYLRVVQSAIGDWIIYYEPRRSGGRQCYFAAARQSHIEEDHELPRHYYAYVEEFLQFDRPVPFREGSLYYERTLQKSDGTTNKGQFGRSVRNIDNDDFYRILNAGFSNVIELLSISPYDEFYEEQGPFEIQREIITQMLQRPFRDRAFSSTVKTAYGDTCAFSGIRLINGGGRSEVQAAHIRPVKDNGPDSLRNGLALSGTMHWMFDRGLVSVEDDYSLLLVEKAIPTNVLRLFNDDRRLLLPNLPQNRPHRQFLQYHREYVFKG